MEILVNELNIHKELMFFTISKTLKEVRELFDGEIIGLLQGSLKIYNKKVKDFLITENYDCWFDKILDRIALDYKNEFFNFQQLEHLHDIQMYVLPMEDDEIYQDFIEKISVLNGDPLSIVGKIYYLSGSWRFYRDLCSTSILDLEKTLALMIRIDREVSFIREEITAALANQTERINETIQLASGHIGQSTRQTKRKTEYSTETMSLALTKKKASENFNKFTSALGVHLGCESSTVKKDLKEMGYDKNNFQTLKERIKTGKV